jgi:hypothetical protein
MHVTQISNPEVFLDKASQHPTEICLSAEVVPENRDGKVWMVPALKIYYTVRFPGLYGATMWHFIEVRKAVDQRASYEGTLLHKMQQEPERYRHRVDVKGPLRPV